MGIKLGIPALLLVLLSACATTQSPNSAGSIMKDFNAPFGSVTAATRHSVESLNVTITGTQQAGDIFTVNFKKSVSVWSWGEVGWVRVYPSESGQVTVEVASQKVMKAQRTGTEQDEFASAIFEGIEKSLADVASN